MTPWTVARQVPRSMEFFRQEHMSEWPFPSPWDLPDQRLNPGLLNGNLNLSLIVTAVFRQETSKKIAAHHRSGLCRGHSGSPPGLRLFTALLPAAVSAVAPALVLWYHPSSHLCLCHLPPNIHCGPHFLGDMMI